MISPDKVEIEMQKIKHLAHNQSNWVQWLDEVLFAGFAQAFTLPVNKRIVSVVSKHAKKKTAASKIYK